MVTAEYTPLDHCLIKKGSPDFPMGKSGLLPGNLALAVQPAANYFFSSVVVVLVPVVVAAPAVVPAVAAPEVEAPSVVAPAVVPAVVAPSADMVEAESVLMVVEVDDSVPVAGVSTVVDFDSHDDRPAVRARPKAATLNRFFILGVILKMG